MKPVFSVLLSMLILLTGCQTLPDNTSQDGATTQASSTVLSDNYYLSNLVGQTDQQIVETDLESALSHSNVNQFFQAVNDYNQTIQQTSLLAEFSQTSLPQYDLVKIDELWQAAKGDFIGTNCRINTFTLLKDQLQIPDSEGDESLLFLDLEAIETGQLMTEEERKRFVYLFGRIETEATKDVAVHAAKMKEHLSTITFSSVAKMLSVVYHDDLDGHGLFIGHVGVMLESSRGVLFVEKLSFQEPYQAIYFSSKDQVYDYLLKKYALDYGQETAPAFIMENDQFVQSAQ
ncbi:TPA: DUF4300 family protein [Streptococcus suis]